MILITGASGTVGKELVKILARPEEPVRVMIRDRSQSSSLVYPGADIVEGDFARPDMLKNALTGIDKAFLLAPPIENQVDLESNFIRAVSYSSVKRVVKLSALGAAPDSPARLLRAHAESERRIEESGIPYTFLRPAPFMQNFLNFRDSIIHRGEFYAPMGDGRVGIVDVRDVATVAAEVLEEHGHENKIYDVTGPESLNYAEMARHLSLAVGKPIAYVDVPPEVAGDAMLKSGIPQWTVDAILELYAIWKFNGAAEISKTVWDIGKKDPITFAEFAHDYAPQFGRTERDPLQELMDEVNLDKMTPGA